MKRLLIILLAVSFLPCSALGQRKVGTTAASFLGIGVGPRATAMGGAYTALSNDVTSLYWNPGAFSRTGESQFGISHMNWLVNTSFNWIGLMLNLDGANAIGMSLTVLDYGEEEVTTVEFPDGTGMNWSALDMAAALSYSRNLTDRFSFGGSFKYIQQKIWNESASSYAVDVGLLFISQFNDLRIAMSIANFGGEMKMDGRDLLQRIDIDPNNLGNNETLVALMKTNAYPLPLLFRIGLAMDVIEMGGTTLTLATDALRPGDNTETVNVGGELNWHDMLYLRAGYSSLFRDDSQNGLTFGMGLNYYVPGLEMINFEYAYGDFGMLDSIHIFGFGIGF